MKQKLKIAIIGSGNIGSDLLAKIIRSPYLECTLFAGRRLSSSGMKRAKKLGVTVSDAGITAIINNPTICDLVFDATNAASHVSHWPLLKQLGKRVIDMTPSMIGASIVPVINSSDACRHQNINMVSCGGQAVLPLIYALYTAQQKMQYVESVVSIASASAGAATRINIDEYIENTEDAMRHFAKCNDVKTILILNPAKPDIYMKASLSVEIAMPDLKKIKTAISSMEKRIQSYVPGYTIVVPPTVENNRIIMMVEVVGREDYLPRYAGNLDIITSAAIAIAERYAKEKCHSID